MTQEEQLQRLRAALEAGNDGVFIVVSGRMPVLGHTSIPLDRLLATNDIGKQLESIPGDQPVEVLAPKGITDPMLRSLNHRRDQLRVHRAVLLVVDPSDSARIARVADDLWKWATIVELDSPVQTWRYTRARGDIDPDRYAPALDPSDVVGPRYPLRAPPEDLDP